MITIIKLVPTFIFIFFVLLSIIAGLIRGFRKSLILFIHWLIAMGIGFALFFIVQNNIYAENSSLMAIVLPRLPVVSGMDFSGAKSLADVAQIALGKFANDYAGAVNIPEIKALVIAATSVAINIALAVVFIWLLPWIIRVILRIFYIIFYSESRKKRRMEDDGEIYSKHSFGGLFVGLVRGTIFATLMISLFSSILFMVGGSETDKAKTEEQNEALVVSLEGITGVNINALLPSGMGTTTELLNALSETRTTGIGALFDKIQIDYNRTGKKSAIDFFLFDIIFSTAHFEVNAIDEETGEIIVNDEGEIQKVKTKIVYREEFANLRTFVGELIASGAVTYNKGSDIPFTVNQNKLEGMEEAITKFIDNSQVMSTLIPLAIVGVSKGINEGYVKISDSIDLQSWFTDERVAYIEKINFPGDLKALVKTLVSSLELLDADPETGAVDFTFMKKGSKEMLEFALSRDTEKMQKLFNSLSDITLITKVGAPIAYGYGVNFVEKYSEENLAEGHKLTLSLDEDKVDFKKELQNFGFLYKNLRDFVDIVPQEEELKEYATYKDVILEIMGGSGENSNLAARLADDDSSSSSSNNDTLYAFLRDISSNNNAKISLNKMIDLFVSEDYSVDAEGKFAGGSALLGHSAADVIDYLAKYMNFEQLVGEDSADKIRSNFIDEDGNEIYDVWYTDKEDITKSREYSERYASILLNSDLHQIVNSGLDAIPFALELMKLSGDSSTQAIFKLVKNADIASVKHALIGDLGPDGKYYGGIYDVYFLSHRVGVTPINESIFGDILADVLIKALSSNLSEDQIDKISDVEDWKNELAAMFDSMMVLQDIEGLENLDTNDLSTLKDVNLSDEKVDELSASVSQSVVLESFFESALVGFLDSNEANLPGPKDADDWKDSNIKWADTFQKTGEDEYVIVDGKRVVESRGEINHILKVLLVFKNLVDSDSEFSISDLFTLQKIKSLSDEDIDKLVDSEVISAILPTLLNKYVGDDEDDNITEGITDWGTELKALVAVLKIPGVVGEGDEKVNLDLDTVASFSDEDTVKLAKSQIAMKLVSRRLAEMGGSDLKIEIPEVLSSEGDWTKWSYQDLDTEGLPDYTTGEFFKIVDALKAAKEGVQEDDATPDPSPRRYGKATYLNTDLTKKYYVSYDGKLYEMEAIYDNDENFLYFEAYVKVSKDKGIMIVDEENIEYKASENTKAFNLWKASVTGTYGFRFKNNKTRVITPLTEDNIQTGILNMADYDLLVSSDVFYLTISTLVLKNDDIKYRNQALKDTATLSGIITEDDLANIGKDSSGNPTKATGKLLEKEEITLALETLNKLGIKDTNNIDIKTKDVLGKIDELNEYISTSNILNITVVDKLLDNAGDDLKVPNALKRDGSGNIPDGWFYDSKANWANSEIAQLLEAIDALNSNPDEDKHVIKVIEELDGSETIQIGSNQTFLDQMKSDYKDSTVLDAVYQSNVLVLTITDKIEHVDDVLIRDEAYVDASATDKYLKKVELEKLIDVVSKEDGEGNKILDIDDIKVGSFINNIGVLKDDIISSNILNITVVSKLLEDSDDLKVPAELADEVGVKGYTKDAWYGETQELDRLLTAIDALNDNPDPEKRVIKVGNDDTITVGSNKAFLDQMNANYGDTTVLHTVYQSQVLVLTVTDKIEHADDVLVRDEAYVDPTATEKYLREVELELLVSVVSKEDGDGNKIIDIDDLGIGSFINNIGVIKDDVVSSNIMNITIVSKLLEDSDDLKVPAALNDEVGVKGYTKAGWYGDNQELERLLTAIDALNDNPDPEKRVIKVENDDSITVGSNQAFLDQMNANYGDTTVLHTVYQSQVLILTVTDKIEHADDVLVRDQAYVDPTATEKYLREVELELLVSVVSKKDGDGNRILDLDDISVGSFINNVDVLKDETVASNILNITVVSKILENGDDFKVPADLKDTIISGDEVKGYTRDGWYEGHELERLLTAIDALNNNPDPNKRVIKVENNDEITVGSNQVFLEQMNADYGDTTVLHTVYQSQVLILTVTDKIENDDEVLVRDQAYVDPTATEKYLREVELELLVSVVSKEDGEGNKILDLDDVSVGSFINNVSVLKDETVASNILNITVVSKIIDNSSDELKIPADLQDTIISGDEVKGYTRDGWYDGHELERLLTAIEALNADSNNKVIEVEENLAGDEEIKSGDTSKFLDRMGETYTGGTVLDTVYLSLVMSLTITDKVVHANDDILVRDEAYQDPTATEKYLVKDEVRILIDATKIEDGDGNKIIDLDDDNISSKKFIENINVLKEHIATSNILNITVVSKLVENAGADMKIPAVLNDDGLVKGYSRDGWYYHALDKSDWENYELAKLLTAIEALQDDTDHDKDAIKIGNDDSVTVASSNEFLDKLGEAGVLDSVYLSDVMSLTISDKIVNQEDGAGNKTLKVREEAFEEITATSRANALEAYLLKTEVDLLVKAVELEDGAGNKILDIEGEIKTKVILDNLGNETFRQYMSQSNILNITVVDKIIESSKSASDDIAVPTELDDTVVAAVVTVHGYTKAGWYYQNADKSDWEDSEINRLLVGISVMDTIGSSDTPGKENDIEIAEAQDVVKELADQDKLDTLYASKVLARTISEHVIVLDDVYYRAEAVDHGTDHESVGSDIYFLKAEIHELAVVLSLKKVDEYNNPVQDEFGNDIYLMNINDINIADFVKNLGRMKAGLSSSNILNATVVHKILQDNGNPGDELLSIPRGFDVNDYLDAYWYYTGAKAEVSVQASQIYKLLDAINSMDSIDANRNTNQITVASTDTILGDLADEAKLNRIYASDVMALTISGKIFDEEDANTIEIRVEAKEEITSTSRASATDNYIRQIEILRVASFITSNSLSIATLDADQFLASIASGNAKKDDNISYLALSNILNITLVKNLTDGTDLSVPSRFKQDANVNILDSDWYYVDEASVSDSEVYHLLESVSVANILSVDAVSVNAILEAIDSDSIETVYESWVMAYTMSVKVLGADGLFVPVDYYASNGAAKEVVTKANDIAYNTELYVQLAEMKHLLDALDILGIDFDHADNIDFAQMKDALDNDTKIQTAINSTIIAATMSNVVDGQSANVKVPSYAQFAGSANRALGLYVYQDELVNLLSATNDTGVDLDNSATSLEVGNMSSDNVSTAVNKSNIFRATISFKLTSNGAISVPDYNESGVSIYDVANPHSATEKYLTATEISNTFKSLKDLGFDFDNLDAAGTNNLTISQVLANKVTLQGSAIMMSLFSKNLIEQDVVVTDYPLTQTVGDVVDITISPANDSKNTKYVLASEIWAALEAGQALGIDKVQDVSGLTEPELIAILQNSTLEYDPIEKITDSKVISKVVSVLVAGSAYDWATLYTAHTGNPITPVIAHNANTASLTPTFEVYSIDELVALLDYIANI